MNILNNGHSKPQLPILLVGYINSGFQLPCPTVDSTIMMHNFWKAKQFCLTCVYELTGKGSKNCVSRSRPVATRESI